MGCGRWCLAAPLQSVVGQGACGAVRVQVAGCAGVACCVWGEGWGRGGQAAQSAASGAAGMQCAVGACRQRRPSSEQALEAAPLRLATSHVAWELHVVVRVLVAGGTWLFCGVWRLRGEMPPRPWRRRGAVPRVTVLLVTVCRRASEARTGGGTGGTVGQKEIAARLNRRRRYHTAINIQRTTQTKNADNIYMVQQFLWDCCWTVVFEHRGCN